MTHKRKRELKRLAKEYYEKDVMIRYVPKDPKDWPQCFVMTKLFDHYMKQQGRRAV